jgi:hypothetical protein
MSMNTFQVANWVAAKSLAKLVVSLPFLQCGNSYYEPDFDNSTYAKGNTINIRRSNRRVGGEGQTVSIKGFEERTDSLTIDIQQNDAWQMTSREQSLFTQGRMGQEYFFSNYIEPSLLRTVTAINQYIAQQAANDLVYWYGSPGTPINSATVLMNTNAFMENLSMPVRDSSPYLIVTPQDAVALRSSVLNLFTPNINERLLKNYFQNEIIDFQFEKTPLIYRHVSGAASGMAGLTVKNTVSSGNTIVITGATPSTVGAIKKGDAISIAGSKIVAPTTFKVLTVDSQWTATADADSDAFGDIIVTVKDQIIPLASGSANANIDIALQAAAPVTVVADHNVNIAFCKPALTYAAPKMVKLQTPVCVEKRDTKFGTGLTVRVSFYADGNNDQNVMRMDVLFGARFFLEFGVKVLS